MDRILTTHVGSLIRSAELTEAYGLAYRGREYDAAAFERQLVDAVAGVVRRQADVGLDVVNDGEFGKPGWIVYIYGRVNGIETRRVPVQERTVPQELDPEAYRGTTLYVPYRVWNDTDTEGNAWVCTGPISYKGTAIDRDIANLKAAVGEHKVVDSFLPVVAPGSIEWIQNEYYPSEEDMMWAFADALREEYTRIVAAGLILQVDDAALWHRYATIRLRGGSDGDYRRWAEPRVEALNHALRGIPEDRVRYHVCSGSNHAPHNRDVPLQEIIDLVLKVNARYYLIEQANAAHEHEWRIWEDVSLPENKVIVPGVITHQTMMVEHPELVAQRITRLAGLVGRERLLAGSDCGFSQSANIPRVPEWTQWAKLQSLAEGARLASQDLWHAPKAIV